MHQTLTEEIPSMMDCNQSHLIKDTVESDLQNVRRMVETTMAGTIFCPNLTQAVTKGSNMVSISKRVIIKGLNTKQKRSRPATLYTDSVNSKEAPKNLNSLNMKIRHIKTQNSLHI
jgi:hypothetical protein